jgi:PleD family two-component response regulator
METEIDCGNGLVSVTASFGVAIGGSSLEMLFRQADAALYCAKDLGRNRVVCGVEDADISTVC